MCRERLWRKTGHGPAHHRDNPGVAPNVSQKLKNCREHLQRINVAAGCGDYTPSH